MIPVIYENLCPVCRGDIREEEIAEKRCISKNIPLSSVYHSIVEKESEELFEKVIGKPREIQRFWIRRISSGESFAAVALTGIGTTVFGLIISIFFSLRNNKRYVFVPTTILAHTCVGNVS